MFTCRYLKKMVTGRYVFTLNSYMFRPTCGHLQAVHVLKNSSFILWEHTFYSSVYITCCKFICVMLCNMKCFALSTVLSLYRDLLVIQCFRQFIKVYFNRVSIRNVICIHKLVCRTAERQRKRRILINR